MAKDLDAMMNLSVDEGFDDEVAGYNLNYQSATRVYSSTMNVMEEKDVNTDANNKSDGGTDVTKTNASTLDE